MKAAGHGLRAARRLIYAGLSRLPGGRTIVGHWFHTLYYDSTIWSRTSWLGLPVRKCPLDLWVYQELLTALKPDLIIECGTDYGGGALYLACLCELLGHGQVLTIDIEHRPPTMPQHPRLRYLLGSSISPPVITQVRERAAAAQRVFVILDSDHRKAHVLQELQCYSEFVTVGSYLIVEDTNLNGYPVAPAHGEGPMEAVKEFVARRRDFVIDPQQERFHLTFNPRGYLRKVAS